MASRPVFIDYHSILATFSNAVYNMIFKKYRFKSKKKHSSNMYHLERCINMNVNALFTHERELIFGSYFPTSFSSRT